MDCPKCGAANAYIGFTTVECCNPTCPHFNVSVTDGPRRVPQYHQAVKINPNMSPLMALASKMKKSQVDSAAIAAFHLEQDILPAEERWLVDGADKKLKVGDVIKNTRTGMMSRVQAVDADSMEVLHLGQEA